MDEAEAQAGYIAELVVQIYNIHKVVIEESDGLEGLRDGAMLHAAVARPFATFDAEDLYHDNFEKAAALFHSLIKSHPFIDGTRQTAFLAVLYFLETRGYVIPQHFPKDEVIRFCLDVAEESIRRAEDESVQAKTIGEIAAWFRQLLETV